MKQQFTGTYSLDVVNRYITLHDIQLKPEQVLLVVNATVGFVYHNFSVDETANISIVGDNTKIEFPPYKDCDTHTNSDALAIFYDDGVDLGQLILTESNETQALLQTEFDQTQDALAAFRAEVKSESDETQSILENEFNETQTLVSEFKSEVKAEIDQTQDAIAAFRAEVKDESDATQGLIQTEFNQTQDAITEFRAEVKNELDDTQTLLQTEFNQTQDAIAGFRTEVKNESDSTQDLLQFEFDQTQDAISHFRTEVKNEFDQTQSILETEFHNTQIKVESFHNDIKDEFNQTQTLLADFKVEVKSEFDEAQSLLSQLIQSEFDQTQGDLSAFQSEVKSEFDQTQSSLAAESAAIQSKLGVESTALQSKIGSESDEIQDKLNTESGEIQTKIGTESANVQSKLLEYKDAIVLKMGQESAAVQDKLNVESSEIQTVVETESTNIRTRLAQHETAVVTKIGVESAAIQAKLEQILIDEYKDAIVDKLGLESLAIRTKLDVESDEIKQTIQTESGNVQGKLLEYKDDIAGTIEAQSAAVQTKLNVESAEIQGTIQTESTNVQGKLLEYKDDIVGTMQAESAAVQTKLNVESDEIKQTLETQSLAIQTKLDQILVDDFKNAIVNAVNTQGDEIQTKLGVESDEVRADLTAWRAEVKAGIDAGLDATGSKDAPTTNSVAGNWSVVSLLKGLFNQVFGKLPTLTTAGRIPVDIGGDGSITVTSGTITVQNEVEISNDAGNPVPVKVADPFVNTSDSTIRTSDETLQGRIGSTNSPIATDDVGGWSVIQLFKRALAHLTDLKSKTAVSELQVPVTIQSPNVRRINATAFTALTGAVQFGPAVSGSPEISAEQVVAVVNTTRNVVYYCQGNPKSRISVTSNYLNPQDYYLNVLGFLTTPPSDGHADSDTVVVYYSTAEESGEATIADRLTSIDQKTPALESGRVPVTLGATVVTGDSHSSANPASINKLAVDLPTGKDAQTNTHPSVTVQPVIGSRNFPISATSLPLPAGAATETTLASIDLKTPELVLGGRVPVEATQAAKPISASTVTYNSAPPYTSSALVLDTAPSRQGFRIFNSGPARLYIGYNSNISSAIFVARLEDGDYFEENGYAGKVYVFADSPCQAQVTSIP